MVNLENRLNLVVFSSPDLGVTDWAAGDYIIRINITTTTSSILWADSYVCRVNTSCVSQETLGSLTNQGITLSFTGETAMTISCSATTALATDRLAFVLAMSNSHEHGGDDAFGYTPDAIITTPIDDGVSASRRIFVVS